MDATHFFSTALPALARSRPEVFLSTKARIAVLLREEGAPLLGWTITFGDIDHPIREGADQDAELVISFTIAAFQSFLEGGLDVTRATKEGAIAADGDVELFARLGYLLQGAEQHARGGM
jgi:hypothetical protein